MIAIFRISLFGFAYGQLIGDGPCPQVFPVQNLDVKDISGKWYSVESLVQGPNEVKCNEYYYTKIEGGLKIKARFFDLHENKIGEGQQNFTEISSGVFKQSCKDCGPRQIFAAHPDYMIIYSCSEKDGKHERFGRINTRVRNPSQETLDEVHKYLPKNHLSIKDFPKIDQKDCDKIMGGK